MKRFIILLLLSASIATAKSQVTSITQLKDVKAGADYYNDLTYMIESLGSVSGDVDGNFRPDKAVTKAYWATVTNATFDRINELISSRVDDVKDSAKRADFGAEMLGEMPTGYCNIKNVRITTTSQLKDVKESAEYYLHVQSLVERYGLVWLATPDTFAPDTPIEQADFETFFADAFGASFTTPGTGLLTRGKFIIYTAAWARDFISKIDEKVKEDNQ
jgi:hypothetical protein